MLLSSLPFRVVAAAPPAPLFTESQIGTFALILAAVIAVVGVLWGHTLSRRSAKEGNKIDSFEAMTGAFNANMKALTDRVTAAEGAAKTAEEKVAALKKQVDEMQEERTKERRDYDRMRTTVQKWFKNLEAKWVEHGINDPMPMPEDADAVWLGLERTIPRLPPSGHMKP